MTEAEFMHHTSNVAKRCGWTWVGGDNVMVDEFRAKRPWLDFATIVLATQRLTHSERFDYYERLPNNVPSVQWTDQQRLRAFSAAIGNPWTEQTQEVVA